MNQNILKLLETPLVPDAQAKVLSYFEEVKGSDTGWQLAITELTRTADNLSDHTKFFWWQIVENFVKTRYTQMDSASLLMRNFLFQWLHNMSISAKEESSFLRNKAAQVFSLVFIVDFPRRWQSFLFDFLQTLKLGPKAVDFYLRVLKAIDSEVVEREIPHSNEEADRNTLIKDTIRETCIQPVFSSWYENPHSKEEALVNSWYEICVKYEMSDSRLVSECLCVICAYISWIDISLFANERFYTLFIRFMKDQHLRESTCDCLCEIVARKDLNARMLAGMDSSAKVKLIESLYSLLHGAGVFLIVNEEDSDYLCKLGKLINTMGVQLAVSWTWHGLNRRFGVWRTVAKDATVALDALENKLPIIYTFFGNGDDNVSASVLECINEYIIILKQKYLLSSVDRQNLESLISINFEKMKYDRSYNFENDGDEEAQFLEFRIQLKKLYVNIASLDKNLILSRTQQLVTSTWENRQTCEFQDAELALTCLYELGEPAEVRAMVIIATDGGSALEDMVRTMVKFGVTGGISPICDMHHVVQLQFFEIQIVMMDFLLNHDMDAFKTVLDQVQREAEPDIVALDKVAAHSVNAFTWCSEAFSNRLEMRVVGPECETPHSALFVQALEIFVKFAEIPTVLPEFQGALRRYCHRLVFCLDKDILQFMPAISKTLLRSSSKLGMRLVSVKIGF